MQDKIIVTPSEVRGLGNIVSEKELEDFLVYMSTITSTSEEVDGITRKVYALGYVPPQVSLTLTLDKTVLDYDERTNLTATLLDENNVGIPNEEVKFYNENSYLFYTGTTDSNGVITINNVYSHQPGQHTYTGVLTSDTTVTGSVTVTINKITSTLSLATSSAAVNVGGSFTLSGTLNAGSGKSVKIYQNGTVIDTVTTGTNGAYSKSITASAEGSFTYYAVFDGDSVYSDVTSSSVIVTVSAAPVPVPASIVLTSDKQILSYVDQDSCTLSATVRDENDVLIEGVTVTFKVDGTSIGTAVTGSNGIATKTYDSQGVGDITCAAEIGMIVSKTYSIIDYQAIYKFDGTESKKQLTGSTTFSNGVMSGGASFITSKTWDNTVDWELTGEVMWTATDCALLIVPPTNTDRNGARIQVHARDRHFIGCVSLVGTGSTVSFAQLNANQWYPIKLVKQNGQLTATINNIEYSAQDWTELTTLPVLTVGVDQWYGSNKCSIRNIKVKTI